VNFQQGIFAVVVDVATARPPAVHAQVFVQVAADSALDAQVTAAQMAACHPGVVMPLSATIVSMVA
jgi:hypothetical protein